MARAAKPSPKDTSKLIAGLITFTKHNRRTYYPAGVAVPAEQRRRLEGYFPRKLLQQVRVLELRNREPIASPSQDLMRLVSGHAPPEFVHMASVTFVDVIVFQDALTIRRLFHSLVHTVQFAALGTERFVELYVRAFLQTGNYTTVPFEIQAFGLDTRFAQRPSQPFEVEAEVKSWAAQGRFRQFFSKIGLPGP